LLAKAQDDDYKTLFHKNEDNKLNVTGFIGPTMIFGSIGNDFTLMMGGGGCLILENLFFGGYGMGITNEIAYRDDPDYNLGFGHGGLWFGYIVKPRKAVHASISGQVGWGSISKKLKTPDGDNEKVTNDQVMVLTPIVEVELNLSKYFKLGGGISCSFLNGRGISQTAYTNENFIKPSFYLSFKFGWFD
jgi:hypothetical protein